ncbi:reverse transcriptase domain-containing protein [Tanacetum coccineum]
MSASAIEQLITQHVVDALLTYEANRNIRNGNGNGNDNGNGSHDSGDGSRRPLHTACGCTIVRHDAAYEMTWKSLIKMMSEVYCPRSEIKKLEIGFWNLTVKGTDVVSYTQRFQELALLCSRMVPEESDKVEK